jgi:hypothetical protein
MLSPDLVVKGVFDFRSFLASAVVVPSDLMFIRKSIILICHSWLCPQIFCYVNVPLRANLLSSWHGLGFTLDNISM